MPLAPDRLVAVWGGMECSLNRVRNDYFDQIEYSGHRKRNEDNELFVSLGLKKMRYPILWEHHQPDKKGIVDWDCTEKALRQLDNNGVEIIAGLVHHGSGPAFVNIEEDSFVTGLADYAGRVAGKFPWINFYTPINEPLTTARFCGLYGLWYPHLSDDASFCRILINECRATILAMAAVRVHTPLAKLVQTEDLGKIYSTDILAYQADFENKRRWLSFDLLCGEVDPEHALWPYLTANGIGEDELNFFRSNPCFPDVIGVNHYLTSNRYLDDNIDNYPVHTHGGNSRHTYADVEAIRVGSLNPAGLDSLLISAWDRYKLPIAVTEVHLHCSRDEQMRWLQEVWLIANRLLNQGINIIAITPWALLGSFGWDQLLTAPPGDYQPGVYDLSSGFPRRTILADMIEAYSLNTDFEHNVLISPGWWNRKGRVTYGAISPDLNIPGGKRLVISGIGSDELASICKSRYLNYIEIPKFHNPLSFKDKEIWAQISLSDKIKICTPGKADLLILIPAEGDISGLFNAALDLFLDGESGSWACNLNGDLIKSLPGIFSYADALAG